MELTRKDLGTFGQMMVWTLYAMYHMSTAVTGASKRRKIQQGVEGGGWRDYTDEEKIDDSLACAKRHIENVAEWADALLSGEYND